MTLRHLHYPFQSPGTRSSSYFQFVLVFHVLFRGDTTCFHWSSKAILKKL